MSRFVQIYSSSKKSPNYFDYEQQPVVTLEKALAPIVYHMHQLSYQIKLAKELRRIYQHYKISEEESAAIYLYTKEWSNTSLHEPLNRALNTGNSESIGQWFAFLKLFITALEKLPSTTATIYRGIKDNVARTLQDNEEVTWWTFSSCSFSLFVIRRHTDEHSTLCSIKPLNAKKIRDFAYLTAEDEVLLLPGTCLRLKERKRDPSTGKFVLYFEEIDKNHLKSNDSNTISKVDSKEPPHHTNKSADGAVRYTSTLDIISNQSRTHRRNSDDGSKSKKNFSTTTFMNGDHYEVPYENGKKQGCGVYFRSNGKTEQGASADSMAEGKGHRTWTNGDQYKGDFKYGLMHGNGHYSRADGYSYKGEWADDRPHGRGTSEWHNGNHYEGDHRKGKIEGYGKFQSLEGDEYIGWLVDGKAHGKGVRIWENGDRYEGDFINDKKDGHGTYFYANGGSYNGYWSNDEMDGFGILVWPSGTRYQGEFKKGKRHGSGILTLTDGEEQIGKWENNTFKG